MKFILIIVIFFFTFLALQSNSDIIGGGGGSGAGATGGNAGAGAAGALANQKMFRIEEIPADELTILEDEMLIPVAHFYKDIYNAFGIPFFIKAKQGEPFIVLKDRIQKRLNISNKEFEKVSKNTIKQLCIFKYANH